MVQLTLDRNTRFATISEFIRHFSGVFPDLRFWHCRSENHILASFLGHERILVMQIYWQEQLERHFGIQASLSRLDGELDLNFMALTPSKERFVVKVMHAGCASELIEMQCGALRAVASAHLPVPVIVPAVSGADFVAVDDPKGQTRLVWVISVVDGVCYADIEPKSLGLMDDLGRKAAALDLAMADFDHPALDREFKWDLMQADWIKPHIQTIDSPKRRAILDKVVTQYTRLSERLHALPRTAIHNDLNDYNVLATAHIVDGVRVSGLIDFGDMVRAPKVCEVAIAGAYAVLDREDPLDALAALVAGYHAQNPLSATEVDMIFALVQMRLAVSVVNSTLMAVETPDDPYVTISQAPAWRVLEREIDAGIVRAKLRSACDMPITPNATAVLDFLDKERGNFAPMFGCDLLDAPMGDLSVAGSVVPSNPFDMDQAEAAAIGGDIDAEYWLGYWGEPRLIYTDDAFRDGSHKSANRRSIHLAIDVFATAGHAIHAPMAGVVEAVENRDAHLDYGGVVILAHETPEGAPFYTLYGHLDPVVVEELSVGQSVAKDQVFCRLGTAAQNGGWAPHVHFQLALSVDGMAQNWPGVADPDQMDLWGALCPNPAAMLNLPDEKTAYRPIDQDRVLQDRRDHFGGNVKLSYAKPVMFLRGWKNHLFDEMGRVYLDAYNNVPHVGHAHPRIQRVAADQLLRMNSNTRYLHPAQTNFAQKILASMPDELNVCYFVNSGSEANELALRLARTVTGGHDIITPDHGYHGNTNSAIEVSAYKFNKPNGIGRKPWVHLVDVADDYRGRFRRDDPDRAAKFANLVDDAISQVDQRGGSVAGFIAETFPSVGGQIIPPAGYLRAVYDKIRKAGGVCIADEVQTGLGRLGEYFYGFQQQQVVPDIVVLGKPIGNGHPIGVVVTTREIAQKFDNGIEYFSTFGGSTLSCRIGAEVLDIVQDEGLQQNAKLMGQRLFDGLKGLQRQHHAIGDVRGFGLFVGVELIADADLTPATDIAGFVINRMRELRILIGAEGPADNILKIRPPLTVDASDIDRILEGLDQSLREAACLTR